MSRRFLMLFMLQQCPVSALAFTVKSNKESSLSTTIGRKLSGMHQSTVSDVEETTVEDVKANDKKRHELKRLIVQLGASYDRGFAASPRVRSKMEEILAELETLNPETNASRYIDGPQEILENTFNSNSMGINGDSFSSREESSTTTSPLCGNWRMIWTTAQDVLILGANPIVTVGAIYQFIDPPIVTNVIDFIPRLQNLLPPSLVPNSMVRAKVTTKASSRTNAYPNRVGLRFERVQFQGQELLGQDVSQILPPLGFDLPRINVPEDVGYFDVTYLDSELLVIRQNAPGGCFVLVNVDSDTDP